MEIAHPNEPGPYVDREFDCARALKDLFDREVEVQGNAFVDVDRVSNALRQTALRAGWTEEDVRIAVLRLARNQQTSNGHIRRVESAQ